jgi:sugar lactone lactonase YvrE
MKTTQQTPAGAYKMKSSLALSIKLKLAVAFLGITSCAFAQTVSTLAGSTTPGSANEAGIAASFREPSSLTTDGNGNLYVSDKGNNLIRKIVLATGEVTTLAGSGVPGCVNGTDTSATFNAPSGIATDGKGNLYVAEQGNNDIRKIVISTGVVTTLAGNNSTGHADGIGTAASFFYPTGLTYDGSGNLYVADKGNNEIRKIVISSKAVSTIAGHTTAGSADGVGTSASFFDPAGIVADRSGNLYVTDLMNNKIRKIVISTSAVSTIAGSVKSGSTDGFGVNASFNAPSEITYDGNSYLYVADTHNNEIRKITIDNGMVTTVAGSTNPGSANGSGMSASFNWPTGITTDVSGTLYVADLLNNEIRMLTTIFTGINNTTNLTSLNLYPNPASQVINLSFTMPNESRSAIIEIVDITGKQIMSTRETINNGTPVAIDISNLTQGIYFAHAILDDNSTQVEKFIKQ